MPWYKTGTVACTQNSTTVTGITTAFAANSRVGDAFLGPDGRWYEVANIASDTVLSILPAYQGATVGAGSYAVAPMQGYVKASADQLRSIVNTFGDKLAALGTTGNYDTLPVGKGGTGVTSTASLLSTLQSAGAYARSNILGTVTQSGGVPTGAIIERGSNANGEYVRYADGTQICWKNFATDASMAAVGPIYGSNAYGAGAYPASFVVMPNVSYCGYIASGSVNAMWAGCYTPPTQTSWGNYRLLSAGTYGAGAIHLIAIGRWF